MTRFLASTIALTLLGAGVAQADTAKVRYADLNLRSAAGQAELDRRIESAARRVCEITPVASRLADRAKHNRCKVDVRAQVTAALPA
ncbi:MULTISPECIES: UrcA family protein [unclassified Novosphingobium]|uniref:UrcA family protein n=1 Tax=unclassified Novosphingobium TaxID=2644732 RepID=UPI0025FDF970|nr:MULTISPECIES: UrcA family protein [unclassified Novosphingobium]HQV02397.1 UrcA family protein [Novosphingobium sp.]